MPADRPAEIIAWELHCPDCGHVERCSLSQMLTRLQSLGLMRRSREPEPSLVVELFKSSAAKFACGRCQHVGLAATVAGGDEWSDFDGGRTCEMCGQPIARERLEALPDTRRCAACQQRDEADLPGEAEYCPRCGEIMKLRLTNRRGLNQYALVCPQCRG